MSDEGGCFSGRLLRDGEQISKSTQNDPLRYSGWLEGTTYKEDRAGLFVRPPEGANLVYSSTRLRRKTIKDVTYEKLVKRFEEVREFRPGEQGQHEAQHRRQGVKKLSSR